MEKKEKKSDLEGLLNSLIEKGWNVFPNKHFFGNKDKLRFSKGNKCVWFGNDDYTLRELVSKESGLWQFVCENRLQPTNKSGGWDYGDGFTGWTCMAYEYRLIESALCDEDKLEEFLLENIKL